MKKVFIDIIITFIMGVLGYLTGKVVLSVAALTLYGGAIVAAPINPVGSMALFAIADATGSMVISPVDPVSTAVAVTTTAF